MMFQTIAPLTDWRTPAQLPNGSADRHFVLAKDSPVAGPSAETARKASWLRRMCFAAWRLCWQEERAAESSQERERRKKLVADARIALLQGRIDKAEATLAAALLIGWRDADCLNLQGVVHEMRKQWRLARRSYGRAMRIDRNYLPAQQNMRRLYELNTFGKTRLPIALWDPLHRC
jgi:tetratricopeptide (TPR) repeat protein